MTGTTATVTRIPACDFCAERGRTVDAEYDFRTSFGPWAFGCERHWVRYRATARLGTGNGQRLVIDEAESEAAMAGSAVRGW